MKTGTKTCGENIMLPEAEVADKRNNTNDLRNERDNYIVVPIRPRSRVVSVKMDETLVQILDKYATYLNARSRSELIKALLKAFVLAAGKILSMNGNGANLVIKITVEDLETGKSNSATISLLPFNEGGSIYYS